jgi:MFS family permease
VRGAAYGLRQALDSAGAFLGPGLAVAFMFLLASDMRAVLWVAVLPAFLAVIVLVGMVHEPKPARPTSGSGQRPLLSAARHLPRRFWFVALIGAVFTLARFSEAFLLLRAENTGLAIEFVPAIMIVMNVVYALFAYPAGTLADRLPARTLLVFGLGVLIAADITLAITATPALAFVGAALWGLHMAVTQGLLSKLVADTAPLQLRGTAFGVFNLVSGGALLLASVIAGALWSLFGAMATFAAGAGFAAVAALGLLLYRPEERAAKASF